MKVTKRIRGVCSCFCKRASCEFCHLSCFFCQIKRPNACSNPISGSEKPDSQASSARTAHSSNRAKTHRCCFAASVSKNDFHSRMTKTSFTRYRHEILPAENHHGFNCSHDTGRLYSALTVCCTNQLKSVYFLRILQWWGKSAKGPIRAVASIYSCGGGGGRPTISE